MFTLIVLGIHLNLLLCRQRHLFIREYAWWYW